MLKINKESNHNLIHKSNLIFPPGIKCKKRYNNFKNFNKINNFNNSNNFKKQNNEMNTFSEINNFSTNEHFNHFDKFSEIDKFSQIDNTEYEKATKNFVFKPPPLGSRIGTEANWKSCLIEPVKDPNKYRKFIFAEFDESIVIYDAFPKAKLHLLLIPRKKIDRPTDLSLVHLDLLMKLKLRTLQITKWIKETFGINCLVGVHAIPSCKQLHIHIISDDFDSKFMKHKRQWNSFNTEYLISVDHLIEQINVSGNVTINEKYYNGVINRGLQCPKCVKRNEMKNMETRYTFAFLNELKRHYQQCQMN